MVSVTEAFENSLKKNTTSAAVNHGRFKWRLWLGPCASMLCIVHCFALPVLLAAAPGFVGLVPHEMLHPLEFVFWAIAAPLGFFTLRNASVSRAWLWAFGLIAMVVPLSLVFEAHQGITHSFFIAMTTLQLLGVLKKHFIDGRHKPKPHCCDHEH